MIKSFRHKGIQQFFESGSKAGIAAEHAPKLARQWMLLNAVKSPLEMDVAGWKLARTKEVEIYGYTALGWIVIFLQTDGPSWYLLCHHNR